MKMAWPVPLPMELHWPQVDVYLIESKMARSHGWVWPDAVLSYRASVLDCKTKDFEWGEDKQTCNAQGGS